MFLPVWARNSQVRQSGPAVSAFVLYVVWLESGSTREKTSGPSSLAWNLGFIPIYNLCQLISECSNPTRFFSIVWKGSWRPNLMSYLHGRTSWNSIRIHRSRVMFAFWINFEVKLLNSDAALFSFSNIWSMTAYACFMYRKSFSSFSAFVGCQISL